jgi:hypothetical protein
VRRSRSAGPGQRFDDEARRAGLARRAQHAVEIIWDRKWVVLVTAYGNTIPFPFESEDYARSYAAGQAFRLGVEVIEMRKCA